MESSKLSISRQTFKRWIHQESCNEEKPVADHLFSSDYFFPDIVMPYFIFIVEVLHLKEALGREALRLLFTAVGRSCKKPKLLVWLKNA